MSTSSSFVQQSISIASVVLHRVRVPFIEPFRISNGVVAEKDSILIEATTDDGLVGWGECSPMSGSFYSNTTPDSSWVVLNEVIPQLLESGNLDPNNFQGVCGDAFARAGVEGALWELCARKQGLALCELFGIKRRAVGSGVAIGIFDTVEALLERIRMYVREGYQRVKIKIQPGWDIEPVRAARAEFPRLPLMVDANASYTLADKSTFQQLDQFELMMIEQPFAAEAIEEAGELQANLKTPLCADESADTLTAVKQLIDKKAVRIINIKVQRVGGLMAGLSMLQTARAAGLECWVGTMPELGIASAQALQLAMHSGFSFPTDIEASTRWYEDDVIEPLINIDKDGFIHVPQGIGSGYSVVREKVEKYATAVARFE